MGLFLWALLIRGEEYPLLLIINHEDPLGKLPLICDPCITSVLSAISYGVKNPSAWIPS